jgi:FkbM family methyltransferase
MTRLLFRSDRAVLSKFPYYVSSTFALMGALRPESWLRALVGRPGPLRLRNGLEFEVPQLLDLLVLKETICDDAYGLALLAQSEPRLVIDVGASIGDFAVLAARSFPRALVIACEPHPHTFRVLERNVIRNGLRNVDARRMAVGTKPSYVLRRGTRAAESRVEGDGSTGQSVAALPLSELVAGRHVDLLKVDCEGAELDVLESAGEQLCRVRRVAVEYHDRLLEGSGARTIGLLREWGFETAQVPDRYDHKLGYVYAVSTVPR